MTSNAADDTAVKTSFGKCRQVLFRDLCRQYRIDIYIGVCRIVFVVDHDIVRLHKIIEIQDCQPEFP